MRNFWISMGTSALIAALAEHDKLSTLKPTALKLFNAIRAAFAEDPDFRT